MAQIRQEINIINSAYTSTGTINMGGVIQIDQGRYYSATTYFFEVVASGATANTGKVTLRNFGTTTDYASITISATTGKQLFRTSFTPKALTNSGNVPQTYFSFFSGDGVHAQTVFSSKVIIIQNAPKIKSTVSSFEIGGQFTTGSTTFVPLQYPKYWYYDATQYSGTGVTALFEATLSCTGATGGVFARLEYATPANTFTTWNAVPKMSVTATTSAQTLYQPTSGYFTLTSNTYYRVSVSTSAATNPVTISNAKIDLNLNDGSSVHVPFFAKNLFGGIAGTSGYVQQFKVYEPTLLTSINVVLNVTSPAPTDQLGFFIVPALTTSVTGFPSTAIAYGLISGANITVNNVLYNIPMIRPAVLSIGTWYCVAIRQPDISGSTAYGWEQENVLAGGFPTYADGGSGNRFGGNTWLVGGNQCMYLDLVGTTGIQNFQTELLLTNTLLSADTQSQKAYTNFNTTDWVNTQNSYSFLIDAASGSTSAVMLVTTGGTMIASGQPKNEIYVSGFTMPYLGSVLDVSATTNNNDIYATKLLVQSNINIKAPITPFFF